MPQNWRSHIIEGRTCLLKSKAVQLSCEAAVVRTEIKQIINFKKAKNFFWTQFVRQ